MDASSDRARDERIAITAHNLRVDAATVEAVRAFHSAGVEALLLKGRSIAVWLYSRDDPRAYNDCDLLVRPGDVETAERVLGDLGFVRHFDDSGLPKWWRYHSSEWWREQDGVMVDLHHALPGVRVDAEEAWRELSADAVELPVAGGNVPVLGLAARALHLALHAAQHGSDFYKPAADLDRALDHVDDALWRNAAELAERLHASESLASGLQLVPRGAALADRLGLSEANSVEAKLLASTRTPAALTFEQIASARGLRERAEMVVRKLVPPPGFMRRWHPLASRGRAGLVLAYVLRPIWLLRAAPRGFRAWREARRTAAER